MMNALLVHDGYFPFGTAFAARLYYIGQLLKYCGHNVHVITSYSKATDVSRKKTYNICGIDYEISDIQNRGSVDTFLGPKYFFRDIKEYINKNRVDVVITSRGLTYFDKLISLCHSKGIKCIVEQCEWLDISSFKFGKYDPRYLKMRQLFYGGYQKADGIIAISRLLEEHFSSIGINSVLIPTILDVETLQFSEHIGEKIRLVFTGSLGNHKELLEPLFVVFNNNRDLQDKYEFHIYGPNKEAVTRNVGSIELINGVNNVVFHGFVSKEEVQNAIKASDFQFFLRPNRRSSNAGCPTKMGESMAVGTPIISNNTGDISLYIKSGINGFIVDDSLDSLTSTLYKITEQSRNDRLKMRREARESALTFFDYRRYKKTITELLN